MFLWWWIACFWAFMIPYNITSALGWSLHIREKYVRFITWFSRVRPCRIKSFRIHAVIGCSLIQKIGSMGKERIKADSSKCTWSNEVLRSYVTHVNIGKRNKHWHIEAACLFHSVIHLLDQWADSTKLKTWQK